MSDSKNKKILRYLHPDSVNKVSETLNSLILYSRDWEPSVVKEKVIKIFNIEKPKLLSSCDNKLVFDFSEKLNNALNNTDPKDWIETVNDAIDPFRRQADVGLTKAKRDIVLLWHKLSSNDRSDFDLPWMRHMNLAEKFIDFLNKDERYIYTGFTNQAILGVAIEGREDSHRSIVIAKPDLENLLTHDFKIDYKSQTSIIRQRENFIANKLKNEKSLTSIFVPKKKEYWVNEKGVTWKSKYFPNKKPTSYDIKDNGLEKRVSVKFISQPVWSVSNISNLFSSNVQDKIRELSSIREMDSGLLSFDDASTLDEAIDIIIEHQINAHSLRVMKINSKACYWPLNDKMAIPDKELYDNPIERYSDWSRELVKSTRHLTERNAINSNSSIGIKKEALISESASFLMIKDLEEQLHGQKEVQYNSEWQKEFNSYYESQSGLKNNSDGLSISALFDELLAKDNAQSVLNEMMSGILNSLQVSKTGKVHGQEIDRKMREKTVQKNFSKMSKAIMKQDDTDATPLIISESYKQITSEENNALNKAMDSLKDQYIESENVTTNMNNAYHQVLNAMEDLNGTIQDRLIILMKHMYDTTGNKSPYNLKHNYYTNSALIILFNEISEHLPRSEGKISRLTQHKSTSDVIPMLKNYKGDDIELLISLHEQKSNYIENEISELRMSASYCDDDKLQASQYQMVSKKNEYLSELYGQIEVTKEALEKANNYLLSKSKDDCEKTL